MSLLLKGILIGLLFGVPVGAVGAMTVQRTWEHGIKAGLLTGMGSSIADCIYAAIGAFGLTMVSDFLLEYQTAIHLAGGNYCSVYGNPPAFPKRRGSQNPGSVGKSADVSLSTREILDRYVERWPVEVFFRQAKDRLASDRYQVRSSQGIRRYWLLMSLAHLLACTGCGETMSFEDGYAYIYSHIQEERVRFVYQCGARHIGFEQVIALVA